MRKMVIIIMNISYLIPLVFGLSLSGQSQENSRIHPDIQKALNIFEERGPSLETYFNLGNAYLRNDSIASAIFYFEHATRIDPTNQAVISNLEIARGRIVDPLVEIPDFFLFSYWNLVRNQLSPNSWAVLSILFFGLISGLVYWVKYKNGNMSRRYLVLTFLILGTATILTLILSVDGKNKILSQKEAIVFTTATMKSGPDIRSEDLKELYPGYKLHILDQLEGWLKVRTIDREEGWILPSWIKIIKV